MVQLGCRLKLKKITYNKNYIYKIYSYSSLYKFYRVFGTLENCTSVINGFKFCFFKNFSLVDSRFFYIRSRIVYFFFIFFLLFFIFTKFSFYYFKSILIKKKFNVVKGRY